MDICATVNVTAYPWDWEDEIERRLIIIIDCFQREREGSQLGCNCWLCGHDEPGRVSWIANTGNAFNTGIVNISVEKFAFVS
jgi:hypothetical protein